MATTQQRHSMQWHGWLVLIMLFLAGAGVIALFAWQTWEFINWLLPTEALLPKMLAVINFDGMSLIWLLAEMFLPLEDGTKTAAMIAGGIDFILSLICTIIQIMIANNERFNQISDPNTLYFADGVIVFALIVNIIAIVVAIRIEFPYVVGLKSKVYSIYSAPTVKVVEANKTLEISREEHQRTLDQLQAAKKQLAESNKMRAIAAPAPTQKEAKQPRPFLAAPGQQVRPAKKLPKMRRLHRLESHSNARQHIALASQAEKTEMK